MNDLVPLITFSRNKMHHPEIFGATYNVFLVPFIMSLGIDVHMDVAVSVSVINPRGEAAGGRNSGRELRST